MKALPKILLTLTAVAALSVAYPSDTRADKLGRRYFEFYLCREHLGIR
jgi:hypothetical protein